MATIHLANKYETKLDERFQAGSFTDKWVGNNYNWDGVNSITIWTLLTDPLEDYNASASSNRFGTPTEVSDEVNTYTLQKKRSFSRVFDETNIQDTMFIRKANLYLKQMWDERYIPEIDLYRLTTWANGAGNVVVNATALTKSTLISALRAGVETLDNANVPSEGRVIFMKPSMVTCYMLSTEMQYHQGFLEKGVIKGQVSEFAGIPVVQVPDSRLPAGINFMIKYKQASADPMKLRMLRVNTEAPGFCGSLMEGLCRYDSFVLAQKADGIYCHFQSGANAAPTFSQSTTTLSIASSDSGTIKYTDDGSNPKTSSTVKTYSAGITVAVGDRILAYVEKSGNVNSGIAEYNVTSVA